MLPCLCGDERNVTVEQSISVGRCRRVFGLAAEDKGVLSTVTTAVRGSLSSGVVICRVNAFDHDYLRRTSCEKILLRRHSWVRYTYFFVSRFFHRRLTSVHSRDQWAADSALVAALSDI